MRGNPFVNLVAILVMLISVLTAGKVWIDWKVVNKKEVQLQEFIKKKDEAQMKADESFEHLHKRTE